MKVTKQINPSLLTFKEDLPSLVGVERIIMEGLSSELRQLRQDLDFVGKTSTKDGEKKRELREERKKLSLSELSEQKSYVRKVAGVTHYNKVECENDLTPMERFVRNAQAQLSHAFTKESEMKNIYIGLLRYFGEDESMSSNDFFGIINRFIVEFDSAFAELKLMEATKVRTISFSISLHNIKLSLCPTDVSFFFAP